jgi:hypothetical protein
MKILVFEYITGGGFNKQELPDSLASEGRLMLNALLDNLRSHAGHGNGIDVVVMLDSRVNGSINTGGFDTAIIKPEQNCHEEFVRLVPHCDAVWPIAPEFDGILQTLCQAVEILGKRLLTSPASAVAVTGNKFNTYQHHKQHHIATLPTRMFTDTDGDILNTGAIFGFCSPLSSGEGWGEGFQKSENRDRPQYTSTNTTLPIESNITSFSDTGTSSANEKPQHDDTAFLLATLRRGPLGLIEALREQPLPENTNLLLVIDQFEEIFRYREHQDRDEADAFVALLLRSVQNSAFPVYIVITMRSDFLGDCALFPGLPEALNDSQFLTPRLNREQRRLAIAGPARVFGGDVEPRLSK